MAKLKNHTNHNQSRKQHRNGIHKPRRFRYKSTKGVSTSLYEDFHSITNNNIRWIANLF